MIRCAFILFAIELWHFRFTGRQIPFQTIYRSMWVWILWMCVCSTSHHVLTIKDGYSVKLNRAYIVHHRSFNQSAACGWWFKVDAVAHRAYRIVHTSCCFFSLFLSFGSWLRVWHMCLYGEQICQHLLCGRFLYDTKFGFVLSNVKSTYRLTIFT